MDNTTHNKALAREELDAVLERVRALALVLTASTRGPDAQWQLNIEAVGVIGDLIFDHTSKINALLDTHLGDSNKDA